MIVYIIAGVLFGIYACSLQHKQYPERTNIWDMTLVFLVNAVVWPIAVVKGVIDNLK